MNYLHLISLHLMNYTSLNKLPIINFTRFASMKLIRGNLLNDLSTLYILIAFIDVSSVKPEGEKDS